MTELRHRRHLFMPEPVRGWAEPKGDRMSRTDKTRPYAVKREELEKADPFDARHEYFQSHNMELNGCPSSCWMCRGSSDDRRKARRERKLSARNWEKEY